MEYEANGNEIERPKTQLVFQKGKVSLEDNDVTRSTDKLGVYGFIPIILNARVWREERS